MRLDLVSTAGLVALALSFAGGCSISKSSQSISDSVSSPFESSSRSSDGDDSAMYREDVERLTLAHLRAGGDAIALRRSIAGLAREQGITDWASDAPTLAGVEAGLRAAGLNGAAHDAYAEQLLGEQGGTLLRLADHPTP